MSAAPTTTLDEREIEIPDEAKLLDTIFSVATHHDTKCQRAEDDFYRAVGIRGTGPTHVEFLVSTRTVDELEAGTLTVRQSLIRVTGEGLQASLPKTAASAATIPLTAGAVAALRAHRLRQIEQRLYAGTAWEETGYVFTTEVGTPVSASNFMRRHFYPIAERAGIPTRPQKDGTQGLRLHDLRHGCGTLLISLGVKPKLVQTILRHSRLATTMDLYVHAYDEDLRGAVASLDRALGPEAAPIPMALIASRDGSR